MNQKVSLSLTSTRTDWLSWFVNVDLLRDDLWKNHPQIHIVDFDFYDVGVFNQCENNNCVLMAVENWRYVHPLLKILPVEWGYESPSCESDMSSTVPTMTPSGNTVE